MKANLKKTFFLFRLGIVVLILALSYWQIITGPSLAIRPENPRLLKQEEKLLRGRILDRKGRVISFTENKERIYQGPVPLRHLSAIPRLKGARADWSWHTAVNF